MIAGNRECLRGGGGRGSCLLEILHLKPQRRKALCKAGTSRNSRGPVGKDERTIYEFTILCWCYRAAAGAVGPARVSRPAYARTFVIRAEGEHATVFAHRYIPVAGRGPKLSRNRIRAAHNVWGITDRERLGVCSVVPYAHRGECVSLGIGTGHCGRGGAVP